MHKRIVVSRVDVTECVLDELLNILDVVLLLILQRRRWLHLGRQQMLILLRIGLLKLLWDEEGDPLPAYASLSQIIGGY